MREKPVETSALTKKEIRLAVRIQSLKTINSKFVWIFGLKKRKKNKQKSLEGALKLSRQSEVNDPRELHE